MPDRIVFPEFREQFATTRYPFADTATLLSTTPGLGLEPDLFLDASLYPIGRPSKLYLATIAVQTRKVVLTIKDSAGAVRGDVSFDPLFPPDLLRLTDNQGRPAGVLVSESLRLAVFSSWPLGTHTFAANAAEFVASCVIPLPGDGVRGIVTEKGDILTGDVWIVGDNGVVVRPDGESGIRVDVVGDPLFLRKLCDPVDLFRTPNFVRTINGCPPDAHGNFNLTVGNHVAAETIVRIYPDGTGLVIEAVGKTVKGA